MKRRRESGTDALALEQLGKYQRIYHDLPGDCLFSIFQFCGASTLVHTIPLVCKTWNQVTLEERLWKSLCLVEWPVLEMVSLAREWKDIGWKSLFQDHATCKSPLLRKEFSTQISHLLTTLTHQERIDPSVLSVVDEIRAKTDTVRKSIDEQMEYDIAKANLVHKYRREKDLSEGDKELIFVEMLRKVQKDDEDSVSIHLRGISGQTVTLYIQLTASGCDWELEMNHDCKTIGRKERTIPGKLKEASLILGLKHLSVSGLWELLTSPITRLDIADNETFWREYEQFCCEVESFEEQMEMEIDDDDYCIEYVDVTDQRAYEEGKKYILRKPNAFLKAPKAYRKARTFINELMQQDYRILSKFPDKMKDKELLDVALKINVEVLRYFSAKIYEDDEKVVQLLKENLLNIPC